MGLGGAKFWCAWEGGRRREGEGRGEPEWGVGETGGTSLPQAAFICCLRAVWVGGEKLVKGREVYCTNGDGADEMGAGKMGGPSVFVRPGLLSPRGRGELFPSQAPAGVANFLPPSLVRELLLS